VISICHFKGGNNVPSNKAQEAAKHGGSAIELPNYGTADSDF